MRSMAGGEVKLFNVAGATKDTIDALDEVNGVSGLYLACSLLGCSCVLCDAPVPPLQYYTQARDLHVSFVSLLDPKP